MENARHDESQHEQASFFGAAKMVAALTVASRLLGLLRDMAMVPMGAGRLADAFWTAFSVPNLFRRLFGEGALSAAFVPVFTDKVEREGWDRARAVLANVAGVLAVILAALMLLIELGLVVALILFGGDPDRSALLQLTAVMLPFMFTVCMLALGSAALQCKARFSYPAFAPILLNVGLLVGWWVAQHLAGTDLRKFLIIAATHVAAGVVQLAGVVWLLGRVGLLAWPRLRPICPEIRQIAAMMGPMVIPLSILQISAFADRLIAWVLTATESNPNLPLQENVVRCLYAAVRLYQFPMGVLAISIATVVFPLLGRYASRNDIPALRDTVNRALRLCLFLGIPSGVALILLAEPIIGAIFERGNFSHDLTLRTAMILRMYCLGMGAYFCNHILLRAFFARRETRVPLLVGCFLAVVNVGLVLVGVFTPLRGGAIGAATALTQSANAVVLVVVLRQRLGRLGARRILASAVRILIATTGMAGAVIASLQWIVGRGGYLKAIAVCVPVGAVAFLAAALALRCPELGELLRRGPGRRADRTDESERS